MPGGNRDLQNESEMPRPTLTGSEVIPGMQADGTPIGITVNNIKSISNELAFVLWSEIDAITPTILGQRAQVVGPDNTNYDGGGAGTHTDPVVGGTVANTGVFSASLSPLGWRRISAIPALAVTSVAGRTGAVTLDKNDVGLANVDNTSDVNKPISTLTQAALDEKIPLTQKAAADGVATLGSDTLVPMAQLNAIVDTTGDTDANKLLKTGGDGKQALSTVPKEWLQSVWGYYGAVGDDFKMVWAIDTVWPHKPINPWATNIDLVTKGFVRQADGWFGAVGDDFRTAWAIDPVYPHRPINAWIDQFEASVPRIRGKRIWFAGDSRFGQGTTAIGSTQPRTTVRGQIALIQWLSSNRCLFEFNQNLAVAGDNTSQTLERIIPLATAEPAVVGLFVDYNDMSSGFTVEQSKTNINKIINNILRWGHDLIIVPGFPKGDNNGESESDFMDTDEAAHMAATHDLYLAWGGHPRVRIADAHPESAVRGSTDGRVEDTETYDGLHPAPSCISIARAFVAQLNDLVPYRPWVRVWNIPYSADNPEGPLNTNPGVVGTTGSGINGTTITGTLPTDWTISAGAGLTAACSLAADSKGHMAVKIIAGGTPTATSSGLVPLDPAPYSLRFRAPLNATPMDEGVAIECLGYCEVKAGHAGLRGLPMYLNINYVTDPDVTICIQEPHESRSNPNMTLPNEFLSGEIRIPKYILTDDVSSASIDFMICGTPSNGTPAQNVALSAEVYWRDMMAKQVIDEAA